ncbi:hypothetical protein MFLAVUS_004226 [Mucor flavus]|uniref:Complex 1 LYR protein domain-containing protein n=1 Tax=Mucor flavus TaxID=439312 RepID=A0ABP9YVD6_9FUNG
MSSSCAIAFQSTRKSLVAETRLKTLDLYKSLLRSSEKYQHADVLQKVIRNRFKQNKHNTSRSRVLQLLTEAEKTQQLLTKENLEDQCFVQDRINTYILQHPVKLIKPVNKSEKKPAQTKRKPYQVAIVAQTSNGYQFKRVRGWVQPVQTSMMLKDRVKTNQIRLDKLSDLKIQLEMIESEKLFLDTLGCLPKDKLKGFEITIRATMDAITNHYYNSVLKQK